MKTLQFTAFIVMLFFATGQVRAQGLAGGIGGPDKKQGNGAKDPSGDKKKATDGKTKPPVKKKETPNAPQAGVQSKKNGTTKPGGLPRTFRKKGKLILNMPLGPTDRYVPYTGDLGIDQNMGRRLTEIDQFRSVADLSSWLLKIKKDLRREESRAFRLGIYSLTNALTKVTNDAIAQIESVQARTRTLPGDTLLSYEDRTLIKMHLRVQTHALGYTCNLRKCVEESFRTSQ